MAALLCVGKPPYSHGHAVEVSTRFNHQADELAMTSTDTLATCRLRAISPVAIGASGDKAEFAVRIRVSK
nr:hypothetical protein [Polymorphobacter sp.]